MKKRINYKGISTLEVLAEARNYNKWIADEISRHVTGRALEIGAGTGNLTTYFLTHKKSLYVSEKDELLANSLKEKFFGNKNIFIDQLDISEETPIKFKYFFSTIFGINVLEHIKNDEQALRNIHLMLKRDGKLVLLVPAKKKAFTKLDKALGHYRRYEKDELTQKLESNNYKVEKIYYFNIVGLIAWFVRDKVQKRNFNLKTSHIKIFDSIVPLLRIIESIFEIPVGISLIVVARKK